MPALRQLMSLSVLSLGYWQWSSLTSRELDGPSWTNLDDQVGDLDSPSSTVC